MMSGDGRYVVFWSEATNLVPDDTNGSPDVFVHDRETAETVRANVTAAGEQVNGAAYAPSISGNGRYVVFYSFANNLVPNDTNGRTDVLRKDLVTGDIELVSIGADGSGANGSSILSGQAPAISDDGRYVVYASLATNVVPGTPGLTRANHIFLRDMQAGTNHLISQASDGTPATETSQTPVISGDGRVVAFESRTAYEAIDTNGVMDIYAREWQKGTTRLVSVDNEGQAAAGGAWRPRANHDGSVISFDSSSPDLVPRDQGGISPDVFVRDMNAQRTEKVSVSDTAAPPDDVAFRSSISADGRFVSYWSSATNFVSGKTTSYGDVFVRDRLLGLSELVSLGPNGLGNGTSQLPGLSGDATAVSFMSSADNLVAGDSNAATDVFAREVGPPIGFADPLELALEEGRVTVSGTPRATGAVLASNSDPRGDLTRSELGAAVGDISNLDVVYRPEAENELLLRVSFDDLPHPQFGVAAPGVFYGVTFTVASGRYEIRMNSAEDALGYPRFDLYRCDPACIPVATTPGGYGTVGDEIHFALSLGAIEAEVGQPLGAIEAFAGVGSSQTGGVVVDEAAAADVVVPTLQTSVGIAPAGTASDQVEFRAAGSGPLLREDFDVSGLEPGSYEIWGRTCLGSQCGYETAAFTVEDDGTGVELVPTVLSLTLEQSQGDVVATARLVDDNGIPLPGRVVSATLNGEAAGTETTSSEGLASFVFHRNEIKRGDQVTVTFDGDERYLASEASTVMTPRP